MLLDDPPPDTPDDDAPPVEETEKPRVSLQQVLDHFKEQAGGDLTAQGDLWEQFIIVFLRQDPDCKDRFKNVQKYPGQDLGIDIIAEDQETGERWAFQAKFYTAGNVSMGDVAGFMSAAEGYDERVVVSTVPLGTNAAKSLRDRPHPGWFWGPEIFDKSRLDFEIFLEQEFFVKQGDLQPRYHDYKELRPHQEKAVADVLKGFKTSNRGKLIMACGTGKTFTALKLAEKMVPPGGSVLFLTPSLSLVSQTLHEWRNETQTPFRGVAVCSDVNVRKSGKRGEDEENLQLALNEFRFPVTTESDKLVEWFHRRKALPDKVSVVYSTYHSIEAVSEAQKKGNLPAFDLVICDEAHRTASARTASRRESYFTLVHDEKFIRAKKRLYMTATPKMYKSKLGAAAQVKDVVVYSMDNESLYGPEFHTLGFRSAVKKGLLSDYKVMILLVSEGLVEEKFRKYMRAYNDSNKGKEIPLDEMARIVGCINGLRKYRLEEDDTDNTGPTIETVKIKSAADLTDIPTNKEPMRRALNFLNTIEDSEKFIKILQDIAPEFAETFKVEGEHVDSNMNAGKRSGALSWLRESTEGEDPPECRILSNVRCLSEGVDVPAMDAVMFLAPRKSKIDIVQSVGRAMRKAKGKKCGYVILPIAIPEQTSSDEEIRDALSENERYRHILEILQALRAHDPHFNIYINQLALNDDDEPSARPEPTPNFKEEEKPVQEDLIDRYEREIYGKIAKHLSTSGYWESWAERIGIYARATAQKIHEMLDDPASTVRVEFDEFLSNLQATLNPSIGKEEAVDMLAQHLVSRPVFDALFKDYAFSKHNPVSQAMQKMLDILTRNLDWDNEEFEIFYEIMSEQVSGVSGSGRQKLILDIYNHFFRKVFSKTAKRLGIVYTPTEIVDFILHSVDYIAQKELGKSLADEGVHILDPFTGTGTFIARLIQSGLIPKEALERKFGVANGVDYDGELHANEIVLLAYYIAAINIESAYHSEVGGDYHPFGGILFGDTFKMADQALEKEKKEAPPEGLDLREKFSEDNFLRAEAQKQHPIRVIIANPPYSVGQESVNDANQNLEYPNLDKRIKETYVKHAISVSQKKAMYDSCNHALRLASDRIGNEPEDEGVIGFVTNGYFLDSSSATGLRYCLLQEFSHVYCFDLRGNHRLSGERVKKEGGKIFGGNSRVPVVILILVKKAGRKAPGILHYHDIGDYLTGEAKLDIIARFRSIENIRWQEIEPNEDRDWLNQRSETLSKFIPMGISKRTKDRTDTESIFTNYSMGIISSRDAWVYNFSRVEVLRNMQSMIEEYNRHVEEYPKHIEEMEADPENWDSWINNDRTQMNWSHALKSRLGRQKRLPPMEEKRMILSQYRPFAKRHLYYDRDCLEAICQKEKFFPTPRVQNKMICVSGTSARKDFSTLMVDSVPDFTTVEVGQCFSLYTWEKGQAEDMLPAQLESSRQENITDYALSLFREAYPGTPITKEDIFYYVYGILHSPEYKGRFNGDLKKIFVRIPLAKDFALFRDAGIKLGKLHLNYETSELFNPSLSLDEEHTDEPTEENFARHRVQKMKFGKGTGNVKNKSIIHYNDHVSPLTNIPQEAFKYQINGRSAIEWVMDQYQVKEDKPSGIVNDPNDWAREHNNPRYVLDLLLRVITVSIGTMKIINSLPKENSFREDDATLNFIKASKTPRNGGA